MAKRKGKKDVLGANVLFSNEANIHDLQKSSENLGVENASENQPNARNSIWSGLGRGERAGTLVVCLLLVVGALGAGFGNKITAISNWAVSKPNQPAQGSQNVSLPTKMNSFASSSAPEPLPDSTPQMAREYVYAGSRLLAVEDAGASAAPPADLAVWRPSDGVWYVLGGTQGSQQTFFQWGTAGDIPVQGDYDGDGKTDFAIFRPSNSNWWITYSGGGGTSYPFGQAGDIPIAADFDGDGKTEAAVFRPAGGYGYWYYFRSSDQVFTSLQFGLSSDIPTPKDFDGDGKADISVWRPSSQTFYALRSSDNSVQGGQAGTAGQIGSGDIPVPADYDGDGKADYAERHGADWQIRQSSNGQTQTITWQQAGDKEVPNDYDGDGKVDIAVWRESNGMWYIQQSHDNSLRQVQWGTVGDKPVPAFYRR